MNTDEFDYYLPEERIAQTPLKDRTALIDITIEVSSKQQIDSIIRKLHRVPGIYDIKRTVQ